MPFHHFSLKGVEGMNGADSASRSGVRADFPPKMLETPPENGQSRFLKRKEEAEILFNDRASAGLLSWKEIGAAVRNCRLYNLGGMLNG